MKKRTTLQQLMNELPHDLVETYVPSADAVSDEVVSRVWQQTKATCFAPPKHSYKRLWLIPAVAVLLTVVMVTGWALTAYVMPFGGAFEPPLVTQEALLPIVSTYDGRVEADAAVVIGDVQMAIEAFTADEVEGSVHVAVHIRTTDETPLSEHTAERLSMLGMTAFKKARLLRENGEVASAVSRLAYRTDDGSEADEVCMELVFPVEPVAGAYVLELTNLVDTVRVMEDIGFGYPSMQALYEAFEPADDRDFVETTDDQGDTAHRLTAGRPRMALCIELPEVYVDNMGFRHDAYEGCETQLYMSLGGFESDAVLALVDTRNGAMYTPNRVTDKNGRVTLCYNGVDEDMLSHLFLMQYQDLEQVTRTKGTWRLPFTVREEDVMPMHVTDIDVSLLYHECRMHATSISLSDNALLIDGSYTTVPVTEGETGYASIYGNVDLVMKDGTVIEDALWQGGIGGEYLGILRYRGFFRNFIDSSQVAAIRAFGQTIPLA